VMLHVNVTNLAALALYRTAGYRAVCVELNPVCMLTLPSVWVNPTQCVC
jgi:hypothetical protein